MNVCLKNCSEAMPPCIMEEGVEGSPPETTSAAEDCNEAVPEWMGTAEAGVKAAKGAIAGKPPGLLPLVPRRVPRLRVLQARPRAEL